jgi:hypothetical protein
MANLRMLLGVGLPLIFVPIMAASFDGIDPSKTDQASAMINAARNTGGSIGVSIVSNVLTHREQFHQSRLVEQVIPSSATYQDTLQHVTNYFVAQGSSLLQAHDQAIQWIGAQVQSQASYLAYGCLLGFDADLAVRRAARACPAQGQTRRPRAHGPLRPISQLRDLASTAACIPRHSRDRVVDRRRTRLALPIVTISTYLGSAPASQAGEPWSQVSPRHQGSNKE